MEHIYLCQGGYVFTGIKFLVTRMTQSIFTTFGGKVAHKDFRGNQGHATTGLGLRLSVGTAVSR